MQFAEMNLIVAERFTLFYNKQRMLEDCVGKAARICALTYT